MDLYKNPAALVEQRVEDILSRMTLKEKVGQMMQLDVRDNLQKDMADFEPGSFLHCQGDYAVQAQELASKTRLGIPLLIAIDAIHGHSFKKGAIIFPTQLGLSSMWNTGLLEKAARITAVEISYTGVHWTFSPLLCLARDARWGRIGETSGEDTFLGTQFSQALIRGYQGDNVFDRRSVMACAKHFAGYSETIGGNDASECEMTERKLRSWFFPPFQEAARNECATFMTAYQAINGTPCVVNQWLLSDVLRDEWGFQGLVVTDWDCVGRMGHEMKLLPDIADASAAAVQAGNDMIMQSRGFFEGALTAVKDGRLDEKLIDRSVRRILWWKFKLGLFEDSRLPDTIGAQTVIGCAAHRDVALACARESLVLLKNSENLLPLDRKTIKTIAVIGPGANDPQANLGDWALGSGQVAGQSQPREMTTTVLDGIKQSVSDSTSVLYARGCNPTDDLAEWYDEAVAAALKADVVILVLGDHLDYVGEFRSTATLELMGGQKTLLEKIAATGKPVVAVLLNSKPLIFTRVSELCAAIIEAFNPGMPGGQAIAEAIFGAINPSGKLTITFPRHAGQMPLYYNKLPGQHNGWYADLNDREPALFPFGFGLSYTTFAYSNLLLSADRLNKGESLTVSFDITNTGTREGREIAQVYINDLITSVTWPHIVLKGFCTATLKPGETQRLSVLLPFSSFALVNSRNEQVVESGEFEIMVGGSSREKDLIKAKVVV